MNMKRGGKSNHCSFLNIRKEPKELIFLLFLT